MAIITSSRGSDDLSIGFDHDRNKRRDALTSNRNIKDKCHVSIMLKDVFGFSERQEKATHGLGYKLAITRNENAVALDKALGIADARIQIDLIHWYLPQYTPCIQQQALLSKQILSKTHTDIRYIE